MTTTQEDKAIVPVIQAEELDALEALVAGATEGPWQVWRERTGTRDEAVAELTEQVAHTEPFAGAVFMLDANGKCPALTGCGPTSEVNANAIAALFNAAPALIAAARHRIAFANQSGELRITNWLEVANLAGLHGIRYRTNTALKQFLSSIYPFANQSANTEGQPDNLVPDYVENYEFRFDDGGGYMPTESERVMLADALYGFIADHWPRALPLASSPVPQGWSETVEAARIRVRDSQIDNGDDTVSVNFRALMDLFKVLSAAPTVASPVPAMGEAMRERAATFAYEQRKDEGHVAAGWNEACDHIANAFRHEANPFGIAPTTPDTSETATNGEPDRSGEERPLCSFPRCGAGHPLACKCRSGTSVKDTVEGAE